MLNKFRSTLWLIKRIRFYAIFRLSLVRYIVCRLRKFYYFNLKKKFKVWDGNEGKFYTFKDGQGTIGYNIKGMHDLSCARSLRLIRPLSCIETYRPSSDIPAKGGTLYDLDFKSSAKVLTIGPRTEGEIFCLIGYGFKPENIRGLDLFSYSPYIDVGDMHHLPYEENSFDIVIASCVLAYSLEQDKATQEILRVLKPGGLICFSHDVNPASVDEMHPRTVQDYLNYFLPQLQRVFYQHELPENLKHQLPTGYTCSVIFQVS